MGTEKIGKEDHRYGMGTI